MSSSRHFRAEFCKKMLKEHQVVDAKIRNVAKNSRFRKRLNMLQKVHQKKLKTKKLIKYGISEHFRGSILFKPKISFKKGCFDRN
jgi:hypothetical protein